MSKHPALSPAVVEQVLESIRPRLLKAAEEGSLKVTHLADYDEDLSGAYGRRWLNGGETITFTIAPKREEVTKRHMALTIPPKVEAP